MIVKRDSVRSRNSLGNQRPGLTKLTEIGFGSFVSSHPGVSLSGAGVYMPSPGVRHAFAIIGGCGEQVVRTRLAGNSAGAHLAYQYS